MTRDQAQPAAKTDHYPRCSNCGRTLGEFFTRPWSRICHRCKTPNKRLS